MLAFWKIHTEFYPNTNPLTNIDALLLKQCDYILL
jgi:hypothetical protein